MKNSLFYLKKVEELYQIISSKREGLSNEEAKQRLAQFGKNVIPKTKKESVVVMFLKEFIEPITFIMLVAAVLSFWLEKQSMPSSFCLLFYVMPF